MGGKKVVVFDFDGVIIDSLKVVQDFDRWLYPGLSEEEWKETDRGNYFQKMAKYEHLRRKVSEEEINQKRLVFYTQKNESKVFPGIVELVGELSKKKILVINTSSKYEGCATFLKKNNIFEAFSFLASKETSISKKEKFKIIFERFNISEKTVFL
jgi:beta-phosphoglucomutase-like phosphatase (HAD superfamily)